MLNVEACEGREVSEMDKIRCPNNVIIIILG